jgi:hypothetical protein
MWFRTTSLVVYAVIFSMFWHSEIFERYFVAFMKTIITSKYNSFEGFYHLSNWRSNYVKASLSIVMDIVEPKDPI